MKLEDNICEKLFDSLVREILHFGPVKSEIQRAVQAGDIREEITPISPKTMAITKSAKVSSTASFIPSRPETLQEGYTGFLYIRCEHCEHDNGFCVKSPITESRCRDCGEKTVLENLHRAYFTCECGRHFGYLTNITDPMFEIKCIECGTPNAVFRNPKTGNYDDGKGRT